MKNILKSSIALAIALCSFGPVAQAAVEDLTESNSTYSSAQYVGDLDDGDLINVFGFRGEALPPLVIDNDDADFFSFDILSAGTLSLNVFTPGGPTSDNDPILGLFDSEGNWLADDDDGGAGYDSFLQYSISTPGTYIVAVSGFEDFDFDGINDDIDNLIDTNFMYTLQAEVTAVPVPTAFWLMGSALVGMIGLGRKRLA